MDVYFEAITKLSVLDKKSGNSTLDNVPTASRWGANELYACRVLCHSARTRALQLRAEKSAYAVPAIRRMIDDVKNPATLKGTSVLELAQEYQNLGHIGAVWAAMAAIENPPNKPDSPAETQVGARTRARAKLLANDGPNTGSLVSSPSSSPAPSSFSAPASSSSGSVFAAAEEHRTETATAEDATVELASAFIKQVLAFLPSQQFFEADGSRVAEPPQIVVEYSGVRSSRVVDLSSGQQIRATADGELYARRRVDGKYKFDASRPVVLLEAKRRETMVVDGTIKVSNSLLGQMAAEAITVCAALPKEAPPPPIYILYAAKATFRVFEFTIPADHLAAIIAGGPSRRTIDVAATRTFKLMTPTGREEAVQAIVALVHRMQEPTG